MANLVTESRARQNPQLTTADGTALSALIAAASAAVEQWCAREFTSTAYTETHNGTGTCELMLRVFPVTTITKIETLDDDAVATEITSGNRVDKRTGLLRLTMEHFPVGHQNVVILYTAGFATIPADVQEAVVQLIAGLHNETQQNASASSERLGEYAVSYLSGDERGLPRTVRWLLSPYRDRHV